MPNDRGKVVYNTSKVIFIVGPLVLIVTAALALFQLFTSEEFYAMIFGLFFCLLFILFLVMSHRNKETVWENCAGILYFPAPLPRRVFFKDVKVVYPLYSYSPTTRKMVTSKLCLIDKDGSLFVFKNLEAASAIILALAPKWKKLYVKDYDIQKLSQNSQTKMKWLLRISNAKARSSKFVVFFLTGIIVVLVGYLSMGDKMPLWFFGLGLLIGVIAYFLSIFLIGALLIKRENAKRTITRAKKAGYTKNIDRDLLKMYLSSDVPEFDGESDMFTEIATEISRAPKEKVDPVKSSKGKVKSSKVGKKKGKKKSSGRTRKNR